jgi:epoxyqueuosine reductase
MLSPDFIRERARSLGFTRVRMLSTAGRFAPPSPCETFGQGTVVLCALSCYRREPEDASRPGEPHGLIAPFARRNYYREAVSRLQIIVKEIRHRTGLAKGDCRIFCNSRYPEKLLAARCGLGFYGSNSLVIAPELGSLFIIAGLFVPFRWPSDPPLEGDPAPGGHCGTCRACIQACPTGAIIGLGEIDPQRCMQALSTELAVLPSSVKEAWHKRLYGCQVCQDVCPFNRRLSIETATSRGELGPSIPLRGILEADGETLRRAFRGTVLGQSWIPPEAIRRNALLAAGNCKDPSLKDLVGRHRRSGLSGVADSAEWACRMIP